MARSRSSEDRLLVRNGFRHYRRTYSLAEVRWGLGIGLMLVAIGGWVWWKGQHPDPDLFAAPPLLKGAAEGGSRTGAAGLDPNAGNAAGPADRGPLPTDLAAPGWTEGEPAMFDSQNLYVKINGRADYFLAFGFQKLHFVSLRNGEADDAPSVDIELYDLGKASNALGAFAGEQKEGEPQTSAAGGVSHLARNALFLARGPYYLRAIGSEESDAMTAQLEHVRARFEAALEAGERPWAYELMLGGMGLSADQVTYSPSNGFSIEGVDDVYIGQLADDSQLFAVVTAGDAEAAVLVDRFIEGFAQLGERDGDWVIDRYLDSHATARAAGRFVIGVRGAPDRAAGETHLGKLRAALDGLPPSVQQAAQPAEPTAPNADDGAAGEGEVYDSDEGLTGEPDEIIEE